MFRASVLFARPFAECCLWGLESRPRYDQSSSQHAPEPSEQIVPLDQGSWSFGRRDGRRGDGRGGEGMGGEVRWDVEDGYI